LIKAVGYFKWVRFVVVKNEDCFVTCHAVFSPLGVLDWDLIMSHVVHYSLDDGIGKGTGNVEKEAGDYKSFPPLFKGPMDG